MKKFVTFLMLSLALTACDKLSKADKAMKSVNEMNDKVDHTNNTMDGMAYDMRLAFPMQALQEQANYDIVEPIAFKLAPWAKKVAQYITIPDLLDLCESQFHEIDDGAISASVDKDGKTVNLTPDQIAKLNNQKRVIIGYTSMIAGFLPDDKVEQLRLEANRGAYSDTAVKLLTLRYSFIKDFLFDSLRMDKTFTNADQAKKAFEQLAEADKVAQMDNHGFLHYESKGLVKLNDGDDDPNYNVTVDHDELVSQWNRLLNKINNDQPTGGLGLGQTSLEQNQQKAADAQELQSLKSQIQAKLDYWAKHPQVKATTQP
jgi:hypothetical protein